MTSQPTSRFDHSTASGMDASRYSPTVAKDEIPDVFINGAVELSVGAKPFVPKSFANKAPGLPLSEMGGIFSPEPSSSNSNGINFTSSSPFPTGMNDTTMTGSDSQFLSGFSGGGNLFNSGALPSLGSGSLGSGLWSTNGLANSLSLNTPSLGDSFGLLSGPPLVGSELRNNYLSGILGQGLDAVRHEPDAFDFDASQNIIPDLDNLLENDLH